MFDPLYKFNSIFTRIQFMFSEDPLVSYFSWIFFNKEVTNSGSIALSKPNRLKRLKLGQPFKYSLDIQPDSLADQLSIFIIS